MTARNLSANIFGARKGNFLGMSYLKAKKLKMGQIFRDDKAIPVTFVKLSLEKGETDEVQFELGKKIKVSGTSKGRGFQGVVKRYGFRGAPSSHGHKSAHRAPGSIGATGPQRVFPGTKMPGRMGGETVTVKNLEVVDFDRKRNLLLLKGAVPGYNGAELKVYL